MTSPRPIRVLHVVLDLHEGGLERVVVDLMRGLPSADVSSEVLCLRRRGQLADELAPESVHVAVPEGGIRGMWYPRTLADVVAQRAPDVVHLHSGVWLKGARAARLAGRAAVVFTDHGRPWPDTMQNRIVDHLGSTFTDAVVAVSEPLRDYLARRLKVDARKLQVIRNAIPEAPAPSDESVAAARAEFALAPGQLLVGSVGRLDPVKAYDVLIRAVVELRQSWQGTTPPKLVLVGDGPDRPRLEATIRALGADDAVILAGWKRDVRPYLLAMDAFVLSSDSEGTSISLLEAMRASRPVIATRVGGNPDVLGPTLAGQLVPAQDPHLLAVRLAETLPDEGVRASVGSRGRARVTEAFSQAAMLDGYVALYRRLTHR